MERYVWRLCSVGFGEEKGVVVTGGIAVGSVTSVTKISVTAISRIVGEAECIDPSLIRGVRGVVVRAKCRGGVRRGREQLGIKERSRVITIVPGIRDAVCHSVIKCLGGCIDVRNCRFCVTVASGSVGRRTRMLRKLVRGGGATKVVRMPIDSITTSCGGLVRSKVPFIYVREGVLKSNVSTIRFQSERTVFGKASCLLRYNRGGVLFLERDLGDAAESREAQNFLLTLRRRKVGAGSTGVSSVGVRSKTSGYVLRVRGTVEQCVPATVVTKKGEVALCLVGAVESEKVRYPRRVSIIKFNSRK